MTSRPELDPGVPEWARNLRPIYDPKTMQPPPKGHVWVEWTGEASPFENPVVQYRSLMGQFTAEQTDMLHALAKLRIARVERKTTRTLRGGNGVGQINGLSVPVVRWGPFENVPAGSRGSFIQALTFADADKVKASASGGEFRIWWERDGEPRLDIVLPGGAVQIVKAENFKHFGEFRRAMGW